MIFSLLMFIILMHFISDYVWQGQGFLANLKQKDYWRKETNDPMYKDDYLVACFEHGLMWSIACHIPIYIWGYLGIGGATFNPYPEAYGVGSTDLFIVFSMIIHGLIHHAVDDSKANHRKINLVMDQWIHFIQLLIIWMLGAALLGLLNIDVI